MTREEKFAFDQIQNNQQVLLDTVAALSERVAALEKELKGHNDRHE